MLHIYRQVTSLRRSQTFVMTKKVEHPRRFRFDDIRTNSAATPQFTAPRVDEIRRNAARRSFYRGEYQILVSILGRRGADMMHILLGIQVSICCRSSARGTSLCLVSFHGADVATISRTWRIIPENCAFSSIQSESCWPVPGRSRQVDRIRLARGKRFGSIGTGIPLREFPVGAAGISG
jgi:hypothetical protein